MRHIHLDRLFALVDEPPARRISQIQVPSRSGACGLTKLETIALVGAMRVVHARRVFEFGSFLSITTLNFALNVPPDGSVLTLDLGADCAPRANQHPASGPLTEIHLKADGLDFVDSEVADKITALSGDSTSFDFGPWKNSMDLVFIEGGHSIDALSVGTENAFAIIAKDKPACILWHGHRNSKYPLLSTHLQQISEAIPVFHIGDTNLWAYFNDPQQKIQARLQERDSGMSLAA